MADFAGQLISTRVDKKMIFDDNVYDTNHSKLVSDILKDIPTSGLDGYKVTVDAATTATVGYLKTYEVKQNNSVVGTIDIPKDFLVKSGSVVKGSWSADGKFTPSDTGDDKALALVLNVKEGSADDETIYINVTDLGKTYTKGNGVAISDTNVISAVKSTSSEKYLNIDSNGISVTGIDEISSAIATEKSRAEKAEEDLSTTISTVSKDSLTSVTGGDGISVTTKESNSQTIGLKLNSTKDDNALTVDSDGLYLSSTIDCGTY